MNEPYRIDQPETLPSPSLVIFRDLVRRNVEAMIGMVDSPDRLRPHVKTHKMPALVEMLESMGISKHKCATIAEAEMIARAGGRDVLLAYPMVGPNAARFVELVGKYPETTFRAVADDAEGVKALDREAENAKIAPIPVLIDLEVGMGRTGIAPEAADDLAQRIASRPALRLDGLHAYDGHIRDQDPEARLRAARPGLDATLALRDRLWAAGLKAERLVLGGTPTFPVHARLRRPGVECSPGTCVLHDVGYATKFPDLPFTPAAAILTRVVSRPRPGRVCLDVGYKAVAADPQGDRVRLVGIEEATLGPQSEEHLVVETPSAGALPPGTPLLAIPTHICPTCALHAFAYVVEDGRVVDRWEVAARDRTLTV
jgi:D-serine deaminase-like pyridoxal phosphate-dependent protein